MLQRLVLMTAMVFMAGAAVAGEFAAHWSSYAPGAVKQSGGEYLDLEFLPGGEYRSNGRHANGWISYESGTFHYEEAAGEFFVWVDSGGFDWPMSGGDDERILYYAETYSAYPRYFRITGRDGDMVAVEEYRNAYRDDNSPLQGDLYDSTPVWQVVDGRYRLLNPLPDERLFITKYYVKP